MVFVVVKSCHVATFKPVGGTHSSKVVDNHNGTLAVLGNSKRQGLAGEAATALIHGNNLEAVYLVVGDKGRVMRSINYFHFFETAI